MAQTYAQLQKQIATLEEEAQRLKKAEVAEVISKMKTAIEAYGITSADLFGAKAATSRRTGARRTGIKYADGQGNSWVGRGKRPEWLRAAIAAGRSLEEFAVVGRGGAPSSDGSALAAKKSAGKKRRKGAGKTKYRDDAGNAWTGFGPQPRWLKDAIAGGRVLDEFKV